MATPSIKDPSATYERVYQELEKSKATETRYISEGKAYFAKLERRRIRGLKATLTRIRWYYF